MIPWPRPGQGGTGSTSILGYEFKISFTDPVSGAFVHSVTTKTLATSGNPVDYLLPGATWNSTPRKVPVTSDGSLDNFHVTVDLVVLADGKELKELGPKHSRRADELLGIIEGMVIVRSKQPS